MNYPKITLPHTLLEVAKKVQEEAGELIAAIEAGEGPERIIEEACDVDQAAETLAHKLLQKYGLLAVSHGRLAVIEKNARRGYYTEKLNYEAPEIPEKLRTFVLPKGEER